MKLHTNVLIGGIRHARVLSLLALTFLACFGASFSTHAATSPVLSSNRFLFIVDASASMKPFDEGVRQAVFDLVYSGMRGRMTNGDTFGLWVVRNQNDTSYPMDVWRSRHAVEMAAKVTTRIKERGFKGDARLDLAMADALRVVRNVGDLTIVLVSNGETPIAGTPFDDAINARFRELAPKMKRAKSSLNTVLVAQNGALVAWAMNGPEFLIEVPYVVPKPRPAQTEIALAKTNVVSVSNPPVTVAVSSPLPANPTLAVKPRISTTPIIITKETVAQERREWAAMASTATNENATSGTNLQVEISSTTNGITSITNSITNAMTSSAMASSTNSSTNAPVSKASDVTPAASVSKSFAAASNNAKATGATTSRPKTEEPAAASTPLAAPATSAATARVEQSRPAAQPLIWASLGGAAAVVCVLIGVFVARSQRREASLISRAIARQEYSIDG